MTTAPVVAQEYSCDSDVSIHKLEKFRVLSGRKNSSTSVASDEAGRKKLKKKFHRHRKFTWRIFPGE